MNTKRYFLVLFLFLFAISLASSQGCADEGWKGYSKIFENKTVTITCTTCDFINFTAVNSNQSIFLNDVSMVKSGSTFSYIFLGTDLNSVGNYQVDGYSNLDDPLAFCFDVTMTGNKPSIGTYIILILITGILFLFLIWINITFNKKRRNELYKTIVTAYFKNNVGHDKGNLGTARFYTFGYALLRNLLMFYYLIIIFFLFIVTELLESFGISSLTELFTTILWISLWGFIIPLIHMFLSFYELVRALMDDINKMYMGIEIGK